MFEFPSNNLNFPIFMSEPVNLIRNMKADRFWEGCVS
jgi:hypothetical protein